jgi:glyceraldehyde-3-phosphate dehydrogenase/erythrose-4-phosphate dehydrogenase
MMLTPASLMVPRPGQRCQPRQDVDVVDNEWGFANRMLDTTRAMMAAG